MAREVTLWLPAGRAPAFAGLVDEARQLGGARALDRWLSEHEESRAAYVHGGRHGLWWEFSLADSFRWQGHISRMRPAAARQRTFELASRFGLTSLMACSVEQITPSERARADLAVALLPCPDLLVWEEPHLALAHQVRELCRAEGIAVLVVAADAPWLHCLGQPARQASRVAR